jgi:hypothetical protein
MIGKRIRDFLPEEDLLAYSEAILRVYNQHGRRDNKFKAASRSSSTRPGWRTSRRTSRRSSRPSATACCAARREVAPHRRLFRRRRLPAAPAAARSGAGPPCRSRPSTAGMRHNVSRHRVPGYAVVTISLKPIGGVPGDATADQMDAVADWPSASPRRGPRQPRAEPGPAACRAGRPEGASTTTSLQPGWGPPTPGSLPTSSPAPASTIARWPTPVPSLLPSAFHNASPKPAGRKRSVR